MILKEDIKIGSVLQIRKADLVDITRSGFVAKIDPYDIYDSFGVKVVGMVGGLCEVSCSAKKRFLCRGYRQISEGFRLR